MGEVVLTVVANEFEAEEVCGLLRVNDIRCMYRRSSSAMDLGGSMRGPFEIVVEDSGVERARELLNASPADDGEPDADEPDPQP